MKSFTSKYSLNFFIKNLLDVYVRRRLPNTFGGLLLAHKAIRNNEDTNFGTTLKFSYTIPERICQKHGTSPQAHATVSSVLALFDEFSSQAFMVFDKMHRPAISIALSAELIADVPPGTIVHFLNSPKKVGNIIGFCDMMMVSDDGKLLARGTHIKYMPMGMFWYFFLGNPISYVAVTSFMYFKMNLSRAPRTLPMVKELFGIGAVFEQFPLVSKTPAAAKPEDIDIDYDTKVHHYEFDMDVLLQVHCNDIRVGTMHGGALAVAAEKASSLSANLANMSAKRLQGIDLHYLSAIKAPNKVTIKCTHEGTADGGYGTSGKFICDGRTMATFRARWS